MKWVCCDEETEAQRTLTFKVTQLINCYNQNLNPHNLALGPALNPGPGMRSP